jgi:hypothetical protein
MRRVSKRVRASKRYKRQYFSVDISSLLLLVDGSGNGVLGGMLSSIFGSVGERHVGLDVGGEEPTDKHIICHNWERTTSLCGVHHFAFHKVMSLVAGATRVHACHVSTTPSGVTPMFFVSQHSSILISSYLTFSRANEVV